MREGGAEQVSAGGGGAWEVEDIVGRGREVARVRRKESLEDRADVVRDGGARMREKGKGEGEGKGDSSREPEIKKRK